MSPVAFKGNRACVVPRSMTRCPPVQHWYRRPEIALAACLGALVLLGPVQGRCEVLVTGSVESVRVEAQEATVTEILAALAKAFGIRYRASKALDRPITGDFLGPLDQVVARVLDDYDYVVKRSPDVVEIVLVGRRKPLETAATGDPVPIARVQVPPPVGRPPAQKLRSSVSKTQPRRPKNP